MCETSAFPLLCADLLQAGKPTSWGDTPGWLMEQVGRRVLARMSGKKCAEITSKCYPNLLLRLVSFRASALESGDRPHGFRYLSYVSRMGHDTCKKRGGYRCGSHAQRTDTG